VIYFHVTLKFTQFQGTPKKVIPGFGIAKFHDNPSRLQIYSLSNIFIFEFIYKTINTQSFISDVNKNN